MTNKTGKTKEGEYMKRKRSNGLILTTEWSDSLSEGGK
jgi:hypothetical protein